MALIAVGGLASSCREATSVEVDLSTDLSCEEAKVVTTSITSGTLDDYERRPPAAVTTRCDAATGRIGSLVFVPKDDDGAEIAIRVVMARNDRSPDACLNHGAAECIIARRVVRFVPHQTLRLSVKMQEACSGVTCPANESCLAGGCVPAFVSPEELEPVPSEPADDPSLEDASAVTPAIDAGTPEASAPPRPDAGARPDSGAAPDAAANDGGKKGKGGKEGKDGGKGEN